MSTPEHYKWICIDAEHMCAHADVHPNGTLLGPPYGIAPIIAYMAGWNFNKVREYCNQKGWKLWVYQKIAGQVVQLWPKSGPPRGTDRTSSADTSVTRSNERSDG